MVQANQTLSHYGASQSNFGPLWCKPIKIETSGGGVLFPPIRTPPSTSPGHAHGTRGRVVGVCFDAP